MRTLSLLGVAFALALPCPAALAFAAEEDHKRGVCPVCRVKEGTAVPEEIRATRVHEGVTYGFCSDECAKEFDRDRTRYIEAAAGGAADSTLRAPLFERLSSAPT